RTSPPADQIDGSVADGDASTVSGDPPSTTTLPAPLPVAATTTATTAHATAAARTKPTLTENGGPASGEAVVVAGGGDAPSDDGNSRTRHGGFELGSISRSAAGCCGGRNMRTPRGVGGTIDA